MTAEINVQELLVFHREVAKRRLYTSEKIGDKGKLFGNDQREVTYEGFYGMGMLMNKWEDIFYTSREGKNGLEKISVSPGMQNLLLAGDYNPGKTSGPEALAMCRAIGVEFFPQANGYALGKWMKLEDGWIFPVTFFKISERDYRRLSIAPDSELERWLVNQIR